MHGISLPIPGFEEYLVSLDGLVFSIKSNKILTPITSNYGYLSIRLHKNGQQRNTGVHRILACAFKKLPSLDSELEVDHINTDITYWGLNNLQVLTKEQHLEKTLKDKGFSKLNHDNCCKDCGKAISLKAEKCQECYSHKPKDISITKEIIEVTVRELGWSGAGRKLSYSDNGLRKRYTSLGGNPKELKKLKVL